MMTATTRKTSHENKHLRSCGHFAPRERACSQASLACEQALSRGAGGRAARGREIFSMLTGTSDVKLIALVSH